MEDKIAKKSEASFGEPFRVRQNKSHEFFYCSKCRKNRRTNPIYYPDSDKRQLICSDCYGKMLSAKHNEAKKVAEVLPEGTTIYFGKKAHRCDSEGESGFEEKYYKLLDDKGGATTVCLYQCKKCGQLIVRGSKYNARLYVKYNVVSSKQKAQEDRRAQFEAGRKIRVDVPSYRRIAVSEFLTRITIKNCFAANHDIEDIQAAVKVLRPNYTVTEEIVPALFCKTCNRYYLLESVYQELREKGILLCNVVEQGYWSSSKKREFYITNQESLLHKMGYNVSANNNLTQSQRCAILKAALDNGLLTKAEILSHLDYLIRRSVGRENLSAAAEKWKQDREFIRGTQKDGSRAYYEAKKIVHRSRNISRG